MKRLSWLAVAAAILFGAAYLGSPFLAFGTIRDAARSGDAGRMQKAIDFPAVRSGLKEQLKAMFASRIDAEPALRNNPFAGLGLKLLPTLIDKMVDAYLTPQSIAVMVAEARPPARPGEVISLNAPSRLETHYAYVNRDLFRVIASPAGHPGLPLEFLLRRRGLFAWTLVRIDLPPKALR